MFAKVLILALALGANAQLITKGIYGAGLGLTGGVPVYRSSANYGGLVAANPWGYGANLGRVAGIGALRTTGAIIGGGALGYGIGGIPAVSTLGVAGIPAVSKVGVVNAGLGLAGINGLGLGIAGLNVARGVSVHQAGPVNAAVLTQSRTVDYTPVPYVGEAPVVQDVDVPPQESPLRINFQSRSSPLQVSQQHVPAEPGQVQVTQSEDEPQTAIHNVHRPVVQQVNEVVQPYRSLTQTVQPVIEQAHTNIAQGEGVIGTGLTSGVIGGSGVLAASGYGVRSGLIGNAGLVGVGGLRTVGLANSGIVGVGGLRTLGLANSGLYGTTKVLNSGLVGGYYGSGLVNGGLVSSGLVNSGLYGLNGLSGLSTYGTATKIARF